MNYDMLILKNGGRFDFWITHVEIVRVFIEKQKLQPISQERIGQQVSARSFKAGDKKAIVPEYYIPWPFPFPGGIKVPHLHFGDDIYYLNNKQWREFSGTALKSLQDKFKNIGSVGYDGLMNLADAIEPLT